MAGNALYDVGMRLRAAELHDEGHGRAAIAALLGMPEETVREWLCTYRSAGIEVLAMMGKKHTAYSFETKLAAVRAVVDEGMTKPEAMEKFGIASPSPFKKWLKAYREEGPEALVSVNIFFTIFTNVFSPIAPTRMRRIRQRGCAAFGV